MTTVLNYGLNSAITFDLPSEAIVAVCGQSDREPIADPTTAIHEALLSPLGLPTLTECVLPDDRVAIAIADELPEAKALLAGAVQTVLEANIEPSGITVVCGDRYNAAELAAAIETTTGHKIAVIKHNSSDQDELAYLATSAEGKSVYLNRAIVDAEFVLPIGCLRVETTPGYHGIHSEIFPAFGDEEARKRYGAPSNEEWAAHRRRRREETQEVARLLGVVMTVQVVPGSRDTLTHLFAGEPQQVEQQGRKISDVLWNYRVPRRASLVVAGIEGDQQSQTWENVARAVSAASAAVEDDGAIVLCTDLACEPGPALQRLQEMRDFESTLLELKKERSPDVAAAIQLLHAMDRFRVYMVSQLDEEVVEDLGIAPITDLADLQRLSQRHESCTFMANAQFATASTTVATAGE